MAFLKYIIAHLIKNFVSKSPIRFCPENSIQIDRRAPHQSRLFIKEYINEWRDGAGLRLATIRFAHWPIGKTPGQQ